MPVAIGELVGSSDKAVIGPIASYVTSIFLIGWMSGGILFGVVGDKLGRVRAMTEGRLSRNRCKWPSSSFTSIRSA